MSLTSFMTSYIMKSIASMDVEGVDAISAFRQGYYSALTPEEKMMEYRKNVAKFTFETRCRWTALNEGLDPFGDDVIPEYDVESDDCEAESAFLFTVPGQSYPIIIFVGNDFSAFDKTFKDTKDDLKFRDAFDSMITDKKDELDKEFGDLLDDELQKHTKFYFIRPDSFYDENTIQEFDLNKLDLEDGKRYSESDIKEKIVGYYLEKDGYRTDDYGFLHDPDSKNEVAGYVAVIRHDDWAQGSLSIVRDFGLAKDKLDSLKGKNILQEESTEEISERKCLTNLCTAMQNVSYSLGIRNSEKEKENFKDWMQSVKYGDPETYNKKEFGIKAPNNITMDMAYINIPSEHLPFLRSRFGMENRPSYYFMNKECHEYGPLQLKITQVVNPSKDTPENKIRTFSLYDPVKEQDLDMAGNISFDRHVKDEYLAQLCQFINLQESISKDRPKYAKMLKEYMSDLPEADLTVEKEDFGIVD